MDELLSNFALFKLRRYIKAAKPEEDLSGSFKRMSKSMVGRCRLAL
jgi:hypothetical protein